MDCGVSSVLWRNCVGLGSNGRCGTTIPISIYNVVWLDYQCMACAYSGIYGLDSSDLWRSSYVQIGEVEEGKLGIESIGTEVRKTLESASISVRIWIVPFVLRFSPSSSNSLQFYLMFKLLCYQQRRLIHRAVQSRVSYHIVSPLYSLPLPWFPALPSAISRVWEEPRKQTTTHLLLTVNNISRHKWICQLILKFHGDW